MDTIHGKQIRNDSINIGGNNNKLIPNGDFDMGTNFIKSNTIPQSNDDLVNKEYVDSSFINLNGSNMSLENYQDFFNNDILDLNTALNLYVDDTIGDDTNDGLTTLTAVKTIKTALSKCSNLRVHHSIVINIGNGVYDVSSQETSKYTDSIRTSMSIAGNGNFGINFLGSTPLVIGTITITNINGRKNIRNFTSNLTLSDNELTSYYIKVGSLYYPIAGNEGNIVAIPGDINNGIYDICQLQTTINFTDRGNIRKAYEIPIRFQNINLTSMIGQVPFSKYYQYNTCNVYYEVLTGDGKGIEELTLHRSAVINNDTTSKIFAVVSLYARDSVKVGNIRFQSNYINMFYNFVNRGGAIGYFNHITQHSPSYGGNPVITLFTTTSDIIESSILYYDIITDLTISIENLETYGSCKYQLIGNTNWGRTDKSNIKVVIGAYNSLFPIQLNIPTDTPVDFAKNKVVYIEGQTHNTKEFLDYHGKMVIDNNTRSLGVNQGLPTSTIDIDGSIAKTHRIITEDTLLGYNDHIIICNSINPIILTLPDATTCLNREYKIINENNGIVSINSITLNLSEIVTVYSDGTDWINIEFIGEQTGKANISGDNITFDTAPTIDISDEMIFDGTSGWYKRSIETIRNFINLQTETITGEKTFNDAYVPTNSILENTSIVNKEYVESLIDAGVIWQNPVDDIVDTLPSGYLNQRVIYNNSIHTYNGSTWDETIPQTGWTVWVVDDTVTPANDLGWYNFNGTTWVSVGTSLNHEYMTNLLGGINNEHYHITQSQHEILTGTNGIVNADSLHIHSITNITTTRQKAVGLVTVNDNDLASNTALSGIPYNNSRVSVYVNGIYTFVSPDKSGICYFSSDGGVTAKTFESITSGDLLYWNGSGKYQLETTDDIIFEYLSINI